MSVNGERALFVAVLRQALRDDDALAWLQTCDGLLVCHLAGFEPDYLMRKLANPMWPCKLNVM
jgi:hypothetical protein